MRTAMRPRYYCDFCKKASGSPSHMKRHEKGCTNRRDRVCGMCRTDGHEEVQTALDELIPFALAGDIGGLRGAAHGCPACMLAAIRHAPYPVITTEYGSYQERPESVNAWQFADDAKVFWGRVNDERNQDVGGYY